MIAGSRRVSGEANDTGAPRYAPPDWLDRCQPRAGSGQLAPAKALLLANRFDFFAVHSGGCRQRVSRQLWGVIDLADMHGNQMLHRVAGDICHQLCRLIVVEMSKVTADPLL